MLKVTLTERSEFMMTPHELTPRQALPANVEPAAAFATSVTVVLLARNLESTLWQRALSSSSLVV